MTKICKPCQMDWHATCNPDVCDCPYCRPPGIGIPPRPDSIGRPA